MCRSLLHFRRLVYLAIGSVRNPVTEFYDSDDSDEDTGQGTIEAWSEVCPTLKACCLCRFASQPWDEAHFVPQTNVHGGSWTGDGRYILSKTSVMRPDFPPLSHIGEH